MTSVLSIHAKWWHLKKILWECKLMTFKSFRFQTSIRNAFDTQKAGIAFGEDASLATDPIPHNLLTPF